MKANHILIISILLTSIFVTMPVQADDTCTPTPIDVCLGIAQLSTQVGGLLGAQRCWQLTTDTADADACDHVTDEGTWELNAGTCITLRYRDDTTGATPPSQAATIILRLLYDNTATIIRTLHNAAPPADNTDFTVCGTDTGSAGGNSRSGTLRIYIRATFDGPGAGSDYDIDSDGTNFVGTSDQHTKGSLRSNLLVNSITTNTPPTGTYCTCFAFGINSDEVATITSTTIQPFGDSNIENVQQLVFSSAVTIETFATQDLDTNTIVNAATIDQTYRFTGVGSALTWLGVRIILSGNSALTETLWTVFAATGHGSGISIVAGNAEKSQTFQASSHARFDNDGVYNQNPTLNGNWASDSIVPDRTPAVYFRSEVFTFSYYILNARGDKIIRNFSGAGFFTGTETTSTVNCITSSTGTATGSGLYSSTFAWPSDTSCTAAATEAGTPYKFRINSQAAVPATSTTQWVTQGTTSNLALSGLPVDAVRQGGFIAAMYASDGSTITGGIPRYAPIFGDSGLRTEEHEVYSIAPFHYNITRFYVYSETTNCGNLQIGESLTIHVHLNNNDTTLFGLCAFGSTATSYTLDRDIVAIQPGDRLTFHVELNGTSQTRAPRLSFSLQGFTNELDERLDTMDSEIGNAIMAFLWLAIVVLTCLWALAEKQKPIYMVAIVACLATVTWLPAELVGLRFIVVGAIALLLYDFYQERKHKKNEG